MLIQIWLEMWGVSAVLGALILSQVGDAELYGLTLGCNGTQLYIYSSAPSTDFEHYCASQAVSGQLFDKEGHSAPPTTETPVGSPVTNPFNQ